jgi:hypothetical protein
MTDISDGQQDRIQGNRLPHPSIGF